MVSKQKEQSMNRIETTQSRGASGTVENIIPLTRAAALDIWMSSRRTRKTSRDSSLRGLAAEVVGDERANRWLQRCDPLEASILSSYLMRRARSSQPINFTEAAAAVWV